MIVDKDIDETEIRSTKVNTKNLIQKTEKKVTVSNSSKQDGRCDDVIVNELLNAQAATIGAWKLDHVIDQMSIRKDKQSNGSRGLTSQVSDAIKGMQNRIRSFWIFNWKHILLFTNYIQIYVGS